MIKIKDDQKMKQENMIKPILSYLYFTNKYIFKKKSSFLFPIFSFCAILFLTLIPNFISVIDADLEIFATSFFYIITSISISLTGIFAIIKSLNLFKDVENDGIEILIVSKPIERWQIIFVRFFYFFLLGFVFALINYFAFLIGLLSSTILTKALSLSGTSIFGYITIYYFSNVMIYIIIGVITILLSLKFSTKLVTTFSYSILGVGIILTQSLPILVGTLEKSYFTNLYNNNAPTQEFFDPNYYMTKDGKIIVYDTNSQLPLTESQKKTVLDAYNNSTDLQWIIIANNFINPVAGVNKIGSVKPVYYQPRNSNTHNYINFQDYNVSIKESTVKNNYLNSENHFVTFPQRDTINSGISFAFDLKIRLENLNEPLPPEPVFTTTKISVRNDHITGGTFMNNFYSYVSDAQFSNKFKMAVNEINQLPIDAPDQTMQDIIIKHTLPLFQTGFNELFSSGQEWWGAAAMTPWNPDGSKIPDLIIDVDQKDFQNKMLILFFYLYGMNQLNNNFSTFSTSNKNIDQKLMSSFAPNSDPVFTNQNNFLGLQYQYIIPFQDLPWNPIAFKSSDTKQYLTFINNGEKASSLWVGLSWSAVSLIILTSTILVYSRKDFS